MYVAQDSGRWRALVPQKLGNLFTSLATISLSGMTALHVVEEGPEISSPAICME
jgi:hypothetical protein